MIYDVLPGGKGNQQKKLVKDKIVYTKFEPALAQITKSRPGRIEDFMRVLQVKIDEKLETPPSNRTIENPFGG